MPGLPSVFHAASSRSRLLVAGLVACLSACEPAPDAAEPSAAEIWRQGPRRVLLVTLDTTRADRLGAYGHAAAETPVIDRLAADGVVFEQAWAPTPLTLPSHASLLTGLTPAVHGVHDNGIAILGAEAVLVSELLSDAGFKTGAFVAALPVDGRFGLDQGFDVYRGPPPGADGQPGVPERPARAVIDDTLAWADTLTPEDDVFVWVHLYDAHHPYTPPEPYASRLADPYDGEIAAIDAELGRLLAGLATRGLADGWLTVITADHGESLGEHGEVTHGLLLHEGAMRIPLVLSGAPVADQAGTRRDRPAGLVGVPATLLDLCGLPIPDAMATSLWGQAGEAEPIYLETESPWNSHRWHSYLGLVWRDHKLIRGAGDELFDLGADPGEASNLATDQRRSFDELAAALDAELARPALAPAESHVPSADELDGLSALGYVGSIPAAPPQDTSTLPDGKALLDDKRLLDEAITDISNFAAIQAQAATSTPAEQVGLMTEGRQLLERARATLIDVQSRNAADPTAASYRGTVELALGAPAEAIPHLERAVVSFPLEAGLRYSFGSCLHQAGRIDEARAQMLAAITIDAGLADAWQWLAWRATNTGQAGEALWHGQRMLEALGPNHPFAQQAAAMVEQLEGRAAMVGATAEAPADLPVLADLLAP